MGGRARDHGVAELTELVGYQIHIVDLIALQDARDALADVDLTPANVTALAFVRDNPACDQMALGRMLSVNRSSAMKLVDKLAARSLLERRAGRDLRCNALHLTLQGARLLHVVLGLLGAADERLCADLNAQERQQLLGLLNRLHVQAGRSASTRSPAHGRATIEERAK